MDIWGIKKKFGEVTEDKYESQGNPINAIQEDPRVDKWIRDRGSSQISTENLNF